METPGSIRACNNGVHGKKPTGTLRHQPIPLLIGSLPTLLLCLLPKSLDTTLCRNYGDLPADLSSPTVTVPAT